MTIQQNEILEPVSRIFKALADPTRLRILQCIIEKDERFVSDIVQHTGTAQANVSKHLSVLRSAGIVDARKENGRTYYYLKDKRLEKICDIVCNTVTDRMKAHGHLAQKERRTR